MSSERNPSRNTGSSASLATTASALIALVAIAAMMTSAPASAAARVNPIESRISLNEAGNVRAVAAAVVAAARELTATHPAPAVISTSAGNLKRVESGEAPVGLPGAVQAIRSRFNAERLLDLPPPLR